MKYLLDCPTCNSRVTVETGQAGQTIQCGCGRSLEVPSIRGLRALEQVVEPPMTAAWTKRKGLAFLGGAMAVAAAAAAAIVLAVRPSIDDDTFRIEINEERVHKEIDELSPAESIQRLQMADTPLLTSFSEMQKQGTAPEHLLPCINLLVAFEGPGTTALARDEAAAVMRQIAQHNELRQNRQTRREAMNVWLVLSGIVFVAGLLTASSALLVREPKSRSLRPPRPAMARPRSE